MLICCRCGPEAGPPETPPARGLFQDHPRPATLRARAGVVSGFLVIPARLASTRLPRKLLLAETGQPLIQHTYEAASRATRASGICVAADHEEIAAAVRGFGGQVRMTSPDCASGTDRVAEIARQMADVEIFVNVQGDEPELSGAAIDLVVELLRAIRGP